jgi:uncharacterized protein YoxC
MNGTNHLIMIFIGMVAIAMVVMAVAMIVVAITASRAVVGLNATVEEMKNKVLPLLDSATEITKTSQALLNDSAPKVKHITDNMVIASDTLAETSKSARAVVAQFDTTLTDVNLRAQRQVARVDTMVTAALTTTAEVAEAIGNGIRIPVQKIAAAAGQARSVIEGLLGRFRAATGARSADR